MTTKDYPLDYIQALHLLTGDEPITLELDSGRLIWRRNKDFFSHFPDGTFPIDYSINDISLHEHANFRIYEPPAPPKLEPVELCEELGPYVYGKANEELTGLIIAQAVRMAREEREAEKKGEER